KYVHCILCDVVCVDLQSPEPVAENTVVFSLGSLFRLPQAGDIRFAVQAWRRRSQIRVAVFCTGNPRIRIVQPLPEAHAWDCQNSDQGENQSGCACSIKCHVPPLVSIYWAAFMRARDPDSS